MSSITIAVTLGVIAFPSGIAAQASCRGASVYEHEFELSRATAARLRPRFARTPPSLLVSRPGGGITACSDRLSAGAVGAALRTDEARSAVSSAGQQVAG